MNLIKKKKGCRTVGIIYYRIKYLPTLTLRVRTKKQKEKIRMEGWAGWAELSWPVSSRNGVYSLGLFVLFQFTSQLSLSRTLCHLWSAFQLALLAMETSYSTIWLPFFLLRKRGYIKLLTTWLFKIFLASLRCCNVKSKIRCFKFYAS